MKITADVVARATGEDVFIIRKILKLLGLFIASELSKGEEANIEYLGTLNKKSRYWSFIPSEYLERIRHKNITDDEIIKLLITENDD